MANLLKKALSESLKELLRKKQFDMITVDEICEKAEVGRSSFYRYFRDKYELLNWLYDFEFCNIVEQKQYKTIWEYYPDICKNLYNDRKFFVNAFSVDGQNSFREFCFEKLYKILINDFDGVFNSENEARFIIKRITYASFDGFQWWLSQEPCMLPEEYEKYSRNMFTKVAKSIAKLDDSLN